MVVHARAAMRRFSWSPRLIDDLINKDPFLFRTDAKTSEGI